MSHVTNHKFAIIESEVKVSEVWQNCHDLIEMSESVEQWAYVRSIA